MQAAEHFERFPDNGKPFNSERSPNHDASPVDIPEHEGLVPNEIPSWIWEGTPKWGKHCKKNTKLVIS